MGFGLPIERSNIYAPGMSKLIAVIMAGLFAAGTMLADPCKDAWNACKASLNKLKLDADKTTQMNFFVDQWAGRGCKQQHFGYVMGHAQKFMTPAQLATFKSECSQPK
jgi:hypothetical protein